MFAMKTFIKLAIAGAALAAGAAQAQITVPPTTAGGSDLILFVTNLTNGNAFVQDLGVNLDSVGITTASVQADSTAGNAYSLFGTGSPGPFPSNGPIKVAPGIINSAGVDTALASFETANSGGNFYYGIIAANSGDGSTDPGQGRFGATYTSANGATMFGNEPDSPHAAGAATSTTSFFSQVNGGTATYAYTSGIGQQIEGVFGVNNGSAIGGTTNFYEIATFGGSNDANVYEDTDAITVGLGGAITGLVSGGSSSVPLPAAFWLLGSGVLGLFGIGRRRGAVAAA
jgi:hypothetical protein